MNRLTASIVTYKNDLSILSRAIQSVLQEDSNICLYIIDNSPTDIVKTLCTDKRIIYQKNKKNIGFGKAHNQVLKKIRNTSKYHVVINPDIYFQKGVLQKLATFMEEHPKVGWVMPKILNIDDTIQYNCKLLPTPQNLLIRRFFYFLSKLHERSNYQYEMQFANYEEMLEVPFLSGCFMFLNVKAIQKVGYFDDRFFLYAEDIDYSRRMHQHFKTIYWPEVAVYHYHQKGSYKDTRLMLYNIASAIKYFNKWGWIDRERMVINQRIIKRYQKELQEKYHF